MSEDYVRQKLWQAVDSLATSAAPMRERLQNAFLSGLLTLQPEDFADERSRGIYGAIIERFDTHEPVASEGTVAASLARMNEDQMVKLAQAIFELDTRYRPP